jgi:hypothetical protein
MAAARALRKQQREASNARKTHNASKMAKLKLLQSAGDKYSKHRRTVGAAS